MPVPIICASPALCQFAAALGGLFSKPQRRYFVTVLLALLLCEERRTMTALLRRVLERVSLSGLSRFLARAPWSEAALASLWRERFEQQLAASVQAEHQRQRTERPRRVGHPKATLVTGYLLLDDSTHHKPKGRKMRGLGQHWSTTQRQRVPGHSLFQALYVLLGRQCPLAPALYRTLATCQREGQPFASKVELAVRCVASFVGTPGTHTHVLTDAWYLCRALWRTARRRGFDISGGTKSNRQMRVTNPAGQRVWQRLSEYAASLSPAQFEAVVWPSQKGGRTLYVHRVRTRLKKLGVCQLLIVRPRPDAPAAQTRYFVSSLLEADTHTVVNVLSVRWEVETFFDDLKELFGSDHYQLMDDRALVRFWTLGCCTYAFLDEQRAPRGDLSVSIGSVRRLVINEHQQNLLTWLLHKGRPSETSKQMRCRLAA